MLIYIHSILSYYVVFKCKQYIIQYMYVSNRFILYARSLKNVQESTCTEVYCRQCLSFVSFLSYTTIDID